jgi:hypothetical protein
MSATTRRTKQLLSVLLAALLLPGALVAQQHQHGSQDSAKANAQDTMQMGDMMSGGMMMDMMSMMQGGNMMVGTPGHVLMQKVVALQPSRILAHADALGLSSAQVAQLEQLKTEQDTAHQEHMHSMMSEFAKLTELFDDEDVDLAELRSVAETAMKPYRAMHGWMIADAAAVRNILTTAQREKVMLLPVQGSGMMMQHQPGSHDSAAGHQPPDRDETNSC